MVMMVWLAVPAVARADGADQLRAQGETLAKQGNYAEAIDAFKASDALRPRASNACYIALAYTRRQLWPQAELFLETCHARATAADPLPQWVAAADEQIRTKLATADLAQITLRVSPAVPGLVLTVSSFAPDEAFAPRTIHLPFGQHVVFARAPGHADAQVVIDVKDRKPQTIDVVLTPTGDAGAPVAKTAGFVSDTEMKWDVLLDQVVACTTPCTLPLDPTKRVSLKSHEGLFDTATVGYLKPDTSVVVTAHPASTALWFVGGGVVVLGGSMALAGAMVLALNCCQQGIVFAGIGVGLGIGGYVMMKRAKPRASVSAAPYVATDKVGVAGRF